MGEADIVSVRGYGRIRVNEVLGVSKKGKERVAVDIIKK